MNRDPRAGRTSPIYEFGSFRLDPAERSLLRDGESVALTPKAFDLLVYLVDRHGRLVEKAALMSALWPDTVVEEANIAYNISALRKVLGDGREDGGFIETVPTRGYRFIAPVVEAVSEVPTLDRRRRRWRLAAAAVLGGVAVATVVLWTTGLIRRSDNGGVTAPAFTQLTANPSDVPVTSQAVSPDGKYLAYCDRTAMHVEVIASGETQTLPNTPGLYVVGWNADGTQIRAIDYDKPDIVWDVSLVGSARRRSGLRWLPDTVSLAPDGSSFLIQKSDGELRIVPLRGASHAVGRIAKDEWLPLAVWTPDAKRVFFLRNNRAAIETFDVQRNGTSVVLKAPAGQFIQVISPPGHDGRLIALMGKYRRPEHMDVWEVPVNGETGVLSAEPRRLTDWRQWGCHQITRSNDGRQVAFLSGRRDLDVFAADFDARTSQLGRPRRLSMSERDDYPAAWLPDNKSVIISSSRTGRQRDIFRQDIDGAEPQLLVSSDDDKDYPRVTGDGRWILFRQSPFLTDYAKGTHVMRAPIEGGIAEEIYASPGQAFPQCSIAKGCIVYDWRGDDDNAVIYALDPIRGKGAALATIPPTGSGYILPDGTELAYIVAQDRPRNHIRIVSFDGKPAKDIIVRGVGDLENLDPLPDGSGWLSANHTTRSIDLVHITRDGTSHLLWAPEHMAVDSAMASRDGKRLAISTYTITGNVWLMTNREK